MAGSEAKLQRDGGDRPEPPVGIACFVELFLRVLPVRLRHEQSIRGYVRRGRAHVARADVEGDGPPRVAEMSTVIAQPKVGEDGIGPLNAAADGARRHKVIDGAIDREGVARGPTAEIDIVI